MNFFKDIPRELEDAAVVDGASHFQVLRYVYLPLSLPALATLGLFTSVWNWNDWFWGLIFLHAADYPLQTFLRSDQSLKAAAILITAVPILLVYPFAQRYFIHGIRLGAVKG